MKLRDTVSVGIWFALKRGMPRRSINGRMLSVSDLCSSPSVNIDIGAVYDRSCKRPTRWIRLRTRRSVAESIFSIKE